MVSEPFWAYPNEYLLGLSGHLLADYYRTTHNMLSHARVVTFGVRRVWFYGVKLGLKSIS